MRGSGQMTWGRSFRYQTVVLLLNFRCVALLYALSLLINVGTFSLSCHSDDHAFLGSHRVRRVFFVFFVTMKNLDTTNTAKHKGPLD